MTRHSDLAGKAIVITGAGRGLGRAYAIHAAQSGASVVVNDVDGSEASAVAEEIRVGGGQAEPLAGSVAVWSAAENLVAFCIERFGALDGFVNNAGIFQMKEAWVEDASSLQTIVEVNLLGTMYCGVHAMRAMMPRRRGVIVNVTSAAYLGGTELSAYAATKGGIATLTYCWAAELRDHGIRVNGLAPRGFTRMTLTGRDHGRPGSNRPPEDTAPLVSFLLSDRSLGINGQVIALDDGTLSIVARPRRKEPAVSADQWDDATLSDAFAGRLLATYESEV